MIPHFESQVIWVIFFLQKVMQWIPHNLNPLFSKSRIIQTSFKGPSIYLSSKHFGVNFLPFFAKTNGSQTDRQTDVQYKVKQQMAPYIGKVRVKNLQKLQNYPIPQKQLVATDWNKRPPIKLVDAHRAARYCKFAAPPTHSLKFI